MKKTISLLILIFSSITVFAQSDLKKIEGESIFTESELFIDTTGDIYSEKFTITVKKHFIENLGKKTSITGRDFKNSFSNMRAILENIENEFGLLRIDRSFPEKDVGDTLAINKQGRTIKIHDYSKVFDLYFEQPVSYGELRKMLDTVENIISIDHPSIIIPTGSSPNDTYYQNQYGLTLIKAEKVFHITEGNPNVILGFTDHFGNDPVNGVHEDLLGRIVDAQYGRKYVDTSFNHGTIVAMVAAATTNNNKGLSSLGGNFKLVFEPLGSPDYILSICTSLPPLNANCPDVVNMSWVGIYNSITKNVIEDLIDLGVVMVSASVNNLWWDPNNTGNPYWLGQTVKGQPFKPFPAFLNFPSKGTQVISTTATQLTDTDGSLNPSTGINPFLYEERFRFEDLGTQDEVLFNYGLSNDPINNPDSAFTDIGAPGAYYFGTNGEVSTHYGNEWGATSNAAPHVTATVGMMLSVNPNLTPPEVYDILIETANYDDIVVPPNAVTNNLPGGLKYNKYIGYGRLDAFEAVKAALPKASTSITSNTTWSGYVHIENNVYVENGATLTVLPGTTVLLDDYKALVVKPGGKLIADGTQADPIVFKSVDPDFDWNVIALNSSAGNILDWCLIEGGYINLSIASKNNTISHTTSRNATYRTMQGWHNQDGAGNASATITYSLFENSPTVGMVAHYIDLDMSYTTVRNNGQAGLYVSSGTVYPFHHNLVVNNGLAQAYRDGIEVKSSGMLYMHGAYMASGFNKVADNADDQVSNYGDLIVGIQSGYNHIAGDYSGGKYLIGNYSGATVTAYYNYWGEPYSNPDMFYGPVSHSSMSSYYPVTHGHNGQAPSKVRPAEGLRTLEDFMDAYAIAESKLGEAETSQELRDELYALYILAGMADDIGLKERFDGLVQGVASGGMQVHNTAPKNKIFQDYAKILYTKSLLRDERYDAADAFLKGLEPSILEGHDKSDYWYLKIVTETYHGKYESAWESLQSYYVLQEAQGRNMAEVRASNSPIEEDLLARLNGIPNEPAKVTAETEEKTSLTTYPNPFNPTTTINFTLPDKIRVSLKVFDMLGREVTELVHGELSSGSHNYVFDASQLSSGVYIYQLKVGNQILTKKMTLIK